MRRILSLVLLALVFPASASAMTEAERLATFTPIAESVWNMEPCLWRIQVHQGATNVPEAWLAMGTTCQIWIGPKAAEISDVQWCKMLVHEYGHAVGKPHTDDPMDIMNHTAPVRDIPYPPCDGAPLRQPTMMEHAKKLTALMLPAKYSWTITCHALRAAQAAKSGRWGVCWAVSPDANFKRRVLVNPDVSAELDKLVRI